MIQAAHVIWLELPEPRTVQSAVMMMSMEHPGERVMMTWCNDTTLAVFVATDMEAEDDDD